MPFLYKGLEHLRTLLSAGRSWNQLFVDTEGSFSILVALNWLEVLKLGNEDSLLFLAAIWPWYISLLPLSLPLLGKWCSYVHFWGIPWCQVLQGQIIWLLTVRFTANMAAQHYCFSFAINELASLLGLHSTTLRTKIKWISVGSIYFDWTAELQCVFRVCHWLPLALSSWFLFFPL